MIDRVIKVATLLILILIAGLLIYAWVVAIPEQTALFKACEEKVLCQNKILKGAVCDRYEADTYITLPTILPPTTQ